MRDVRYLSRVVALSLGALVIACGDGGPGEPPTEITVTAADLDAVARGIHERVITIDTHDDIPFDFATAAVDPGTRGDRQVDLPKMREGGLDVGFFVVYVGQGANDEQGYAEAYSSATTKFDAIHRMTEQMYPEEIELAYSADDVERIHASGKLVAAIGIENGWPIGTSLDNLREFHARGGRYITLAHNGHNQIADSANPAPGETAELHGGISEFGFEVIAEMNRLGVIVDVSHVSRNAMLQAAERSAAPVMASHSACRALCDVSRNMDDEQLLALRDNGGVIQVVALGAFVRASPERDAAIDAIVQEVTGIAGLRESFRTMAGASDEERAILEGQMALVDERVVAEVDVLYPPPDVRDFVDHIDYAVSLIGVDHVGISSDFDGGGGVVGWNDASETFNVTRELVERGYSEADIAKLWGGNTLRVWRQVEEVARQLQAAPAQ